MLITIRNLLVNIMAAFIRDRDARHKFRNKYKVRSKFRKLRDDNRILFNDINKIFNENKNLYNAIMSLQNKLVQIYDKDLSIRHSLSLIAHDETINYIKNKIDLSTVILFSNKLQHLLYCAKKAPGTGLFIECGVFRGTTINFLAENFPDKQIHGFDSFEGLPDDWSGTGGKKGTFDLKGVLPEVRANVNLHKGLFNPVLNDFLINSNEKIAFLHVDCDLYQSTVDIFSFVKKYIQCGTIIVFDEMFNYPNWQNHEFKAFQEFITSSGFSYKYIAINSHQQCGIKITDLGTYNVH